MKRLLSITMALVLMVLTLSTGLTAMAGTAGNVNITKAGQETEVGVTCTYRETQSVMDKSYMVSYTWEDMEFVYKKAMEERWDKDSFSVVNEYNENNSGWIGSLSTRYISVTNKSSVGIILDITEENIPSYLTVTGTGEVKLQPKESVMVGVQLNDTTEKIPDSFGTLTGSIVFEFN